MSNTKDKTTDQLVQEYLKAGGKITKCPDGPYEGQLKGWGDIDWDAEEYKLLDIKLGGTKE